MTSKQFLGPTTYHLSYCSIFDKRLSSAIDLGEIFYKNSTFLAEIDKNLDLLGHTSMK